MTLISSLHNFSRSLGLALLLAGGGKELAVLITGCEMVLYLLYKVVRKDFIYWTKAEGILAILVAFFSRVVTKIIVRKRASEAVREKKQKKQGAM